MAGYFLTRCVTLGCELIFSETLCVETLHGLGRGRAPPEGAWPMERSEGVGNPPPGPQHPPHAVVIEDSADHKACADVLMFAWLSTGLMPPPHQGTTSPEFILRCALPVLCV